MSKHKIAINLDGISLGAIKLGDTDISDSVRAVDIHAAAGDIPAVTVELVIDEVDYFGAEETEVLIPEHTKETLVALGWTPPQEA